MKTKNLCSCTYRDRDLVYVLKIMFLRVGCKYYVNTRVYKCKSSMQSLTPTKLSQSTLICPIEVNYFQHILLLFKIV